MAITNAQILQLVYAHIGSEKDSGIIEPLVIAMADLAYIDLARFLLDTNSELSKKLMTIAVNQTWASSKIAIPTDMLFYKQKDTTRIDVAGTLFYQIEDRDRLSLVSGLGHSYYALEGKFFYFKEVNGVTGTSTMNISYYKVPTKDDIDLDLKTIFIEILLRRLIPNSPPPPQQK